MPKLQENNKQTETEILVGKRLLHSQPFPAFELFFLPVLQSWPVNWRSQPAAADLRLQNNAAGYKLLTTSNYTDHTPLLDIFYMDSGDLPPSRYKRELLWKIIDTYKYVLEALQLLQLNQIIHFDIKMDNMRYSKNETVQLIEFGAAILLPWTTAQAEAQAQSMRTNKTTINIAQPLEVQLIARLGDGETAILTADIANGLIAAILPAFAAAFAFFSPAWLKTYRADCEQALASYIGQSSKDIRHKVLTPSIMYTWDHYALNIAYLRLLGDLFPDDQLVKFPFFINYIQLLAATIQPDPHKRLDLATTQTHFRALVYADASLTFP